MKPLYALLAAMSLVFALPCVAQQTKSSTTIQLTVTAAQQPAAVSITPVDPTVAVGKTLNLTVKVAGDTPGVVPTGQIDLLAKAPGATSYTLVDTFTLANGSVACSYPIPATAPLGVYSIKAEYEGDGNYF